MMTFVHMFMLPLDETQTNQEINMTLELQVQLRNVHFNTKILIIKKQDELALHQRLQWGARFICAHRNL